MEEKERYGCRYIRGEFDVFIDNETDKYLTIQEVKHLLNQQDKENQQLKQQLHDLPKKIVEEIKGKLHDRLSKIAGYGRMTTDEFSFFVENEFTKDIDTILKKYGGENE